jgi:hypothetical protein
MPALRPPSRNSKANHDIAPESDTAVPHIKQINDEGFQNRPTWSIFTTAPWWWWEARPFELYDGDTTMLLVIGIVLTFVGLAYLCWLLFTLAVYAFPLFVGASLALAALHSGSGPITAGIVGLIGGGVTLVSAQWIIGRLYWPPLRAMVALIFAAPAAAAGYHAILGLAQLAIPAEIWQQTMAVVGAIAVAATAWSRVALIAPPDGVRGSPPASAVRLLPAANDG